MHRIIDVQSKPHRLARLATGLAISASLLLGVSVASASAADHRGDNRDRGGHRSDYRNHGDYRGDYGYPGRSNRYYPAPPVIYGSPYYGSPYSYPPPVVYGPGIGIGIMIR